MSRSQLADEACQLVTHSRNGSISLTECEPTATVCLARVTIMLGLYGSKPDAILSLIHDYDYPEVTLADVEAVREFVLEKFRD